MFYSVDMLSSRKRGKLSRVWYAAILSERLFKRNVSSKVVMSISIDAVCDEILRQATPSRHHQWPRFSLYLSSQLMYGIVKVFSYQTSLFQATLARVQQELRPTDLRKKKKTSSVRDDIAAEIDLPEPPPLREVFKKLHLQPDIHLLPEADLEAVRAGVARAYVKSPTFGVLTDEQVDLFLTEDDWQLQTLIDLPELNEPIRYGADETNKQMTEPPAPIEPQDFATTNGSKTVDDTTIVDGPRDATLKTPKKRESKITDVETPTKRRRRNLDAEMNAAGDRTTEDTREIPLVDSPAIPQARDVTDIQIEFPVEQSIDQIPDITTEIPVRRSVNVVPEDSEIHLESLEFVPPMRPRGRRMNRNFIDKDTTLLQSELARHIGNILAHTILPKSSSAVAPRSRIMPAISMLKIPSTTYHADSEDWLLSASRYKTWAVQLQPAFNERTNGPFISEDDYSMTVEAIRAADSRIQPMPEEISSGLGRAMESSRSKTTDEPSSVMINPPAIPPLPIDDDQLQRDSVRLDDIVNVPILEHTGDADTVNVTNEPDSNVIPAVTNIDDVDTNVVQADGELVQAEIDTSDQETGDIDAFLPPKLRRRSTVTKTSQEKKTPPKAPRIHDSPASLRSERSLQCDWTKPDLQAQLAVLWDSCPSNKAVTLTDLVTPQDTNKVNAAACFTLLLQLHRDRVVKLAQAEPYGDIFIYKAVPRRQGPLQR